jgi:hemolysin activation/secretion protein
VTWPQSAKDRPALRSRRAARAILGGFFILLIWAVMNGAGFAQTAHPAIDPNQAEKTLDAQRTERRRAKETTPQVRRVALPEVKADLTPLFILRRVSIEGANVIDGEAIAETYRRDIGKKVSQAGLAAIAGKIGDLYREAGFHLSRAIVPVQDIQNGRVRIRVIEGRITDIVISGEGIQRFGIRPLLDPIIAENPSRLKTLERHLLLVNDRPGARVADAALEEIGVATGNFRLTLAVETWRAYTSFGLDNWGQPAAGPLETFFSTAFNSTFVSGDVLGIDLSTVPDATREFGFGRLFYEAPIGVDGVRLGAVASYGEIQPGDERRALNTRELVESVELRASIVPLRTRISSLKLTATAGFANDFETDTTGTIFHDHVRTVGLTADYQLRDDYGGANYLTLGMRQGLNVFGASEKGDPLLSRSDASGVFSKLEFQFARYQKLTDVWSLKMAAAGQWASRPLLLSQQFYIGGPAFGRGYGSGEVSGDSGVAGSLELRFDQELKRPFLKGYQLYNFVDRGTVWELGTGRAEAISLSSAGTGIRLYFVEELQADVGVAFPIDYRSPTNPRRDPRVFFSISNSFKWCPDRPTMKCI